MTGEFSGRAAFVMGGTQGIGWATAQLLAEKGASVAVFGTEEQALSRKSDRTSERGEIIAFRGDGSDESQVRDAIEQTAQHFGRLDILICTAAIHPYGDAIETSFETFNRALAVNLGSAFLTSHYGLPHLLKAGGGAVVNVASNQGVSCNPNVAAYATTKGAVLAFTRTLANDFAAQNIRANSVSPGPVDTPMLRTAAEKFGEGRSTSEVYEDWRMRVPNNRIASAEEIARVIVFLAGEGGSYCSGSNFVCDGGLLARLGF